MKEESVEWTSVPSKSLELRDTSVLSKSCSISTVAVLCVYVCVCVRVCVYDYTLYIYTQYIYIHNMFIYILDLNGALIEVPHHILLQTLTRQRARQGTPA